MQDAWLSKKADEIQGFADKNDMKNFYSGLKEIYGPTTSGTSRLLNIDGTTLITDKEDILKRWAEHFDSVLNRPSVINDEAINRLPQIPTNEALDIMPTREELLKAINQLSRGKAPGSDSIPAEIYKNGGPALVLQILQLFKLIWQQETVPQDLRDASIIHLYKRKGNRQDCNNHRGISLLSTAGKILARILLNRLMKHLEQGLLPESQCGFRKERGTISADTDIGIGIRHRMDGSVFNLRRLKAKTKVKTDTINDFLFADDCALNSISADDMQQNVDKFAEACTNFGLTISIKKTEVMHQPAPGKTYTEPSITINGQCLKAVNKVTYLGSTLSRNVIDDEADARLAKANSAFGRLSKNVWNRRGITLETKIKVYRAAVLTTLLYGSEIWTVYQRHGGKLNHFHTTHLRKLLGIKWQDKIPDTEVLARAGLPSIHTLLKKSQLRWAGHVARMPDNRLPKKLLFGELQHGKRSLGGPKKCYKDTLKGSLKSFNLNPDTWELAAQNRNEWRASLHNGAITHEKDRTITVEKRRQARKSNADRCSSPASIPCPKCTRTFRAQIGLTSHLRTHH